MEQLSNVLKQLREQKSLSLKDLSSKTNISISLLSKYETGNRLPNYDNLVLISNIYNEHKEFILSLFIAEDITNKYLKNTPNLTDTVLKMIKTLSKKQEITIEKPYSLENRRYIGSKTKLMQWIIDTVNSNIPMQGTFADIFGGTGIVTKSMAPYFDKVIINDLLYSNNIIYNSFFKNESWDKQKVNSLLDKFNTLETDQDNYFSTNYGDKFFDLVNARKIGHIRELIQEYKNSNQINDKEYAILLTSLIYSIDKIANTVGHYDAYIKKPISERQLVLKQLEDTTINEIEIYRENTNELVKRISADVVYIDPPYNSRQYSRFYHLYENLVKWNKPQLFGVALKPEPENMSVYCTVRAKDAFQELINNLNCKYIVVSYNNTYNSKSNSSENKIKLEELQSILENRGATRVFECDHKYFNTGKTDFKDHKELLFITTIND